MNEDDSSTDQSNKRGALLYYSIASSQFNIAIDTKDNSSYSSRKGQSQHREEEEDEKVISISLSLKYNCTHTNTHRGNNGTFPSLHQQQQQHAGRKRKLSTRFSPSQPSLSERDTLPRSQIQVVRDIRRRGHIPLSSPSPSVIHLSRHQVYTIYRCYYYFLVYLTST